MSRSVADHVHRSPTRLLKQAARRPSGPLTRAALLAALLLVGLPLGLAPAAPGARADAPAALTVAPSTVAPGQSFALSGSGFGAGEAVAFSWDGGALPGNTAASAGGSFATASVSAPITSTTGPHQVSGRGLTSARAVTITVSVPAPALLLSPASGVPGARVSATGSAFGASEPITISFNGAQVANGAAGADGSVGLGFNVPGALAEGVYAVTLRGATTGRSAQISFAIVGGTAIALAPTVGSPGTMVAVSGSGFGAGEPLTLLFDGASLATATSSGAGTLSGAAFTVPNPVATGAHTVTVRGTTSGRSQSAAFTVAGPPSVALAPNTGASGTTIVVTGSAFGATEPVTVSLDGLVVASSTSTAAGMVGGIAFVIPNPVAAGAHTVVLRGTNSGQVGSTTLTVTGATTIVQSPTSGGPGATVVVTGSGFGATEPITVSFDASQVATATSSSLGVLPSITYAVPNPVAIGQHTVVVRGTASGRSQSAAFTVNEGANLSLTPITGGAGTVITVTGSGFGASEPITVAFDGAQVGTATSSNTGVLAGITLTVPGPVASGIHTVVARGGASGQTQSAAYTVNTPATLALSAASAAPGATVVLTGSGFGATEPITVAFDGVVLTATTSAANGALAGVTLTVPAAATGVHTISARGQGSGQTASVSLTILPGATLTLTPAAGVVGSGVNATLSGFTAGELVTVSANGATLATRAADASGALSGLLMTIPAAPGGSLTVTARGASSGRSAQTVYQVSPALTASASAAVAGSTIALTGTGYAATERVDLTLGSVAVGSAVSDASGSFHAVSVVAPASLSAGSFTLTGRGATSGRSATVALSVSSGARVTISRTTAIAGGLLTVSGAGFSSGEAIAVRVDGTTLRSTVTDSHGGYTVDVVLPGGLSTGAHTIGGFELTTGRFAQTALTIVAPAARVSRTLHFVGSLLPRSGAALLHINGILTLDIEPQTGDFSGHAHLLLDDGRTTLSPTGWLLGSDMRLRVSYVGVLLIAQGQAINGNRIAGLFTNDRGTQARGFWAATQATTAAPVRYSFSGSVATGPTGGVRYQGTLNLLGDAYGGLIGFLRLPRGVVYPVSGQQVNGNLNMQVIVRTGTPFFVVGTANSGGYSGTLAGPLAGDSGTWSARALGAALPLPAGAMILAGASSTVAVGSATLASAATVAPALLSLRLAAPASRGTFHFSGTLLPSVGASLVQFNGILRIRPDATGTFDGGSSTLSFDDGSAATGLQGTMNGDALTFSFIYKGLRVAGQGRAISANRFAGVFSTASGSETRGFWAATRAITSMVIPFAFSGQTTSGPDHGTAYQGTLDLLGDTYGGLIGFLRLPGGVTYPVSGQQVNGNLNMQVIVRTGTPFFVVGTISGGQYSGMLAGPLAGDSGTWSAQR